MIFKSSEAISCGIGSRLNCTVYANVFFSHSFNFQLIPGLTRYKFNQAKEHIEQFRVGEPVTTKKLSWEKYTVSQLDHFIDFITSGQIVKDQHFGEKTLKMETVIWSLTPSSIISQYVALCNEENVKPLGK